MERTFISHKPLHNRQTMVNIRNINISLTKETKDTSNTKSLSVFNLLECEGRLKRKSKMFSESLLCNGRVES